MIYQLSLVLSFDLSQDDIYYFAPKGEKINYKLFKSLERIIKTENRYILVLNLHASEYFWGRDLAPAYHIIVCDHNLVVQGACIQPKAIITSANDSTIYAWTCKSLKNDWFYPYTGRANEYRNDLPKNIKFKIDFKNERYKGEDANHLGIHNFNSIYVHKIDYSKFNILLYAKTNHNDFYEIIELPISKSRFLYNNLYYLEYIGDSSYYNNFIIGERKEVLFELEDNNMQKKILYNLWINADKAKKKQVNN